MFCWDFSLHPHQKTRNIGVCGQVGQGENPGKGPWSCSSSPGGVGRRSRVPRVRISRKGSTAGFTDPASAPRDKPSPRRASEHPRVLPGAPPALPQQPKPRVSHWPRAEPALFLATSLKFKLICYLSDRQQREKKTKKNTPNSVRWGD